MPTVCWPVAPNGRYDIDVALAGAGIRCGIDLGLTDPLAAIGFELDPMLFDQFVNTGRVTRLQRRERRDASGVRTKLTVGEVTAQLLDPQSHRPVGPVVTVHAARGARGLHNRVGVEFFHRLMGCRVVWDLDARLWCVECP
jgi:hypothetical protein